MANAHLKYAIALWFVTCYLCVYVHVGRHFCSSDVIITDDGVMHQMVTTITSPQAASKSHEHERFMPKTLLKKYHMQRQQYKSSTNPEKIIVNVGMPRTGTRSWMATMEKIFPNTNAEYHHVATGYIDSHFNSEDLAELLLFGNQSSPANPLYRYLMHPPTNGVRVMADLPWFLLAPIAKNFPHVYWVQVTRELESHINSTIYMLETHASYRCKCKDKPRCSKGSMALIDRLYYDKYNALGHICNEIDQVPRDLVRTWLKNWEEETYSSMIDHPHFLQLRLEDTTRSNAEKMVKFLELDMSASILNAIDFESIHVSEKDRAQGI